jgi:cyclic beta-1,2-glucan synthetase
VRQAVQAHAYWRLKGLAVDLVIWNEDDSVYRQTLQEAIVDLVAASPEAALVDRPGGIFIRRGEQMSEEDRALLQTVARIVSGRWRNAGGASRAPRRAEVSIPPAEAAPPPPDRRSLRALRGAIWHSSTAWAVSATTAAST